MSDDVSTLLKHQEALAAIRQPWDSWCQDIAYRVLPSQAQFTTISMEGEKRTERLFDARAVSNNERFAAVMEDLLTPRTQKWSGLKPEDETLADHQGIKVHFDRLNNALFSMRYRPAANFASQKAQGYSSVGAFGNSCMFIDEVVGEGARYSSWFMNEVFWAPNLYGMIDTIYRRYKLAARNIVQRFKDKTPKKIADDASANPFKQWELIHCVRPNEERKVGRKDYRGMPWSSYFIDVDGKQMIEAGGYRAWPFAIGRYMLGPNETYARSPAMACWSAIMTLNEEKKTVLRAGQKQVDPPILLTEDGALEPFNLRAGALNHGLLNDQGVPLAQAFQTGADIPLGLELMQLEREQIDDSFLVTIFKILTENPQMTATQVLEIAQQKGVLLAPVMGRQQAEDLGPMIDREIDILSRDSRYKWIVDEMPEELFDSGGAYKIDYKSPLARAMRAQEGAAILRTFEALPTAASIDPNAALVIDVQESMRELAEINGVPAKLIRDKDTVDKIVQQRQAEEQELQAVASAPEMSQAALNAAKAEQLRSGMGG